MPSIANDENLLICYFDELKNQRMLKISKTRKELIILNLY
jgi:hypothetical protein